MLKINTTEKEELLLLRISGRLDAAGAKELQEQLATRVADDVRCVIIDMNDVAYISSATLRVFVIYYKKLSARDGLLVLAEPNEYCRQVLTMGGMTRAITVLDSLAEAETVARHAIRDKQNLDEWDRMETVKVNGGTAKVIPGSAAPVNINVLGDVNDVLYAQIGKKNLVSKRFSDTEYSIGLGALGDQVDDYFTLLGEMITIGGTMVWLPTDGNDTPDFLIPKVDTGKVTIRTGFNVAVDGEFNELFYFSSDQPEGTSIGDLYRALFNLAKRRRPDFKGVIALAARAEMPAVYGSGVTKAPVDCQAPGNDTMIIDRSCVADWFEFDKDPRYRDVTALICGVGIDMADISAYDEKMLKKVFYINPANTGSQDQMLHNHAVFFSPLPMPEKAVNLEQEINTVVDAGDFIDMRHLLDNSTVSRALVGVGYVQEFHPDPDGF